MKSKVKRNQEISNRRIQEAAKKQELPGGKESERFRLSPAGRRLAALRKKKMDEK